MRQSNSLHLAFAVILLLVGIGVIIALVATQSQTETATTTLSVTNESPTVDTVKLCSGHSASPTACSHIGTATGVTLTAGSTAQYQIAGTISDANGWSDITDLDGSFLRSSVTCESPTDGDDPSEQADCYYEDVGTTGGCTITQTTSTSGYYDCNLNIQYYATATSSDAIASQGGDPSGVWEVRATVEDTSTTSVTSNAFTEVNTLRAIGTDTGNDCNTISYGEIANGAATVDSSGSGTDCVLTNDGNVDADITVQASHMSCTFGGIATTNQRINTTSGSYSQMATGGTDLSSSPQTIDIALDRSTGSTVTESVYFGISVPSTGASGSCTGTNTIVAIDEV